MATPFTIARDRDAHSAVAGYVYQAQMTILRWLRLEDDEALEVECGEDIDIISQGLATNVADERLLEQIKQRSSSITLRSPPALEAIANFAEHRRANPVVRLRFRFTTNATIGTEQHSPFPNREPGIKAWEELRRGVADPVLLAGIRSILLSSPRPSATPCVSWDALRELATGDRSLLELVRGFEWGTAAPNDGGVRAQILECVHEMRTSLDHLGAEELYERLLVHVVNAIARKAARRLTRPALSAVLDRPTLSEADRELLRRLELSQRELSVRVATAEGALSALWEASERHSQILSDALIDPRVGVPAADPPPLTRGATPRSRLVGQLGGALAETRWLAIHGAAGAGKTQLALLVSAATEKTATWFRLDGLSSEVAAFRIDSIIAALLGQAAPALREPWYRTFGDMVGRNGLVVLDGLPAISSSDSLLDQLRLLVRTLTTGPRVLSTSQFQLPVTLTRELGPAVVQTPCPQLTDEEVRELLAAAGAPPDFLSETKNVSLINDIGTGNPTVIAATADFLRRCEWKISLETFSALMKGEHVQETNRETTLRLVRELQDVSARELLYRLSLPIGHFKEDDALALAHVEPPVQHPREALERLIGPWLQRDIASQLRASPLARALGTADLAPHTVRACRLELAERILRRPVINQLEAVEAVLHLAGAEEFDRSGMFLASALSGFRNVRGQDVSDGGLLSIWVGAPLPEEMNTGVKIFLRGQQIATCAQFRKPLGELAASLDALVSRATPEQGWAVLGAAIVASVPLATHDQAIAIRLVRKALQENEILSPDGKVAPKELRPEFLVWALIGGITSASDLRAWLEMVDAVGEKRRVSAQADASAEAGSLVMADSVWRHEADKPQAAQDWRHLVQDLAELEAEANRLGFVLLEACLTQARVIALAEYLDDLPAALSLAEGAAASTTDVRAKYLLLSIAARQLFFAKRFSDAALRFDAALSLKVASYPLNRMNDYLRASVAASFADRELALAYSLKAVELAQSDAEIRSPVFRVKAYLELAISYWDIGDKQKAFDTFETGAVLLIESRTDQDDWKHMMVQFGHCAGYFASVASTGKPPARTGDGSEYPPPFRGMFISDDTPPERLKYFDARRVPLTYALMTQFAEGVGRDARATFWASEGLRAARGSKIWIVSGVLAEQAILGFLAENRFADALDFAIDVGAYYAASSLVDPADRELFLELDFSQILGHRTSPGWAKAERNALELLALQVVLRLCTLALESAEAAHSRAIPLVESIRQVQSSAAAPRLWGRFRDIVRLSFIERTAWTRLAEIVEQEEDPALKAALNFAAAASESMPLDAAAALHVQAYPFLVGAIKVPSMEHRTTVAYIESFWRNAARRARFAFRNPSEVERRLSLQTSLQDSRRIPELLEAVCDGLGVRLPKEAHEYLRDARPRRT